MHLVHQATWEQGPNQDVCLSVVPRVGREGESGRKMHGARRGSKREAVMGSGESNCYCGGGEGGGLLNTLNKLG